MSGPWDAKYTDEQREAAAAAYLDGMTGREVEQAAADGRLKHDGKQLAPFEMPASTIASYAHKLRRRRAGRGDTKIGDLPPRDAIETLRRQLVSIAHEELQHEKRKKRGNRDPARIREWTRCVLEASRLPGPTDARPRPSTVRTEEGAAPIRTTGGVAGALLKDHRGSGPARNEPQHSTDNGESTGTEHSTPRLNEREDDGPGALTSEREHRAAPLVVGG